MIRPKRLLRGVVKTAIKASPIPVPDFVQEQLGLQNDEMKSLSRKIDRLEKKLDKILELVR
ncbi:MAG: hypothetical protein CL489_06770 [Acidobacteria bacterium]|nr:hypothetical protein [Acidobacteriota bacterium]|tara:strand:- start:300 stop:482 length:183 start_codon:yes stop_codon:yes gene_type:complete